MADLPQDEQTKESSSMDSSVVETPSKKSLTFPGKKSAKSTKVLLSLFAFFFILASIPAAVYLVKQRQEIRKEAQDIESVYYCLTRAGWTDEPHAVCGNFSATNYAGLSGNATKNISCVKLQHDRTGGHWIVRWNGPDPKTQNCSHREGYDWSDQPLTKGCTTGYQSPTEFDWSSCASCQTANLTDYSEIDGTITVQAKSWNAFPNATRDNSKDLCSINMDGARSKADFKFVLKEDGVVLKEVEVIKGSAPEGTVLNYNCQPETGAQGQWDDYNHHPDVRDVLCDISYQFSNLTLELGKTYAVEVSARINSNFEWRNPETVCSQYRGVTSAYSWCGTETETPSCLASFETQPCTSVCTNIKAYDDVWNPVTDFSALTTGQEVFFAVIGTTDCPSGLTRGRFRINGGAWLETNDTNASGEFYISYTIPSTGAYTVEAMVYNEETGWR